MVKPMNRAWGVIALLASLTLVGCDATEDQTGAALEDEPIEDTSTLTMPEGGYQVEAEARTRGEDWVMVDIATNVPGRTEVMASLTLPREDRDALVRDSHKVQILDGKAETFFQMIDYPTGEYRIEVALYPRWGLQDETSKATGIDETLVSEAQFLEVVGSGESAEEYGWRKDAQSWVMQNVTVGDTWVADSWQRRFGDWEEFPATKRNPRIIKNYYFPRLDMTITVNDLKKEVATWGMGREGL